MEDEVKQTSAPKSFADDRGGATIYPHPVIGIVKNNVDPTRTGRIKVFINKLKGNNPDDESSWITVNYLSPFFGHTPNTASKNDYGSYTGNPNSYGFWATPPDLDSQVICVFVNGDPSLGYYIGGVPVPGMNHMVPAIGATNNIIANSGEAGSYGGAPRLPVAELNNANIEQADGSFYVDQPRPIHSYLAAILNKQGLLRDPDRGVIGSSSQRETPSRVFGLSTPGRPIYSGGFTDENIKQSIKDTSIPDKNFQVVGRLGGHSIVMDDGDLQGRDQLLRLRTSTGHMIMMNDSAQTLFIIHANGQSYIELGKEGTIDMYSTNSVNIRTQGDLNLHADNNININAAKNLNIAAENIKIESEKETTQFAGTTFKQQTKSNHTVKVDGSLSMASKGDAGLTSGGTAYIKGNPNVNLNTGEISLKPENVKQLAKITHPDTLYDEEKGYATAPGKLPSITSRAPAHAPWEKANLGVDVSTNMSSAANLPSSPSANLTSINDSVPPAPPAITTPSLASTVPNIPAASPTLDKNTTSALVSQMAVNAATGAGKNAIAATAGIVTTDTGLKVGSIGGLGLNPSQYMSAGLLKPGSDVLINSALQSGKSLEQAIPSNLFTGKDGVKSLGDLVNNQTAQTGAAVTLLKQGESSMVSAGLITDKESPTQKGGLILSAATAGADATINFAKSALTKNIPGIGALGLNAAKITNPLGGSISNLISGGNFASNLADKALGGLPDVSIADKLKGMAAAAFSKVTSAFKPFKAGEPQNLTVIKAEGEAAASGIELPNTDTVQDKISPPDSKSLTGLIDGAKSLGSSLLSKTTGGSELAKISSTVNSLGQTITGAPTSIPGVGGLSSTLKNITASVSGSLSGPGAIINGAKSLLTGANGLTSLVSKGLGTKGTSELNNAIAALGSGGPVEVKLPTVKENSFDTAGLAAQSKALLGDPKIPPLKFGSGPPPEPSPDETKLVSDYQQAVKDADEKRQAYYELKAKLGANDPQTVAAYEEYKSLQQAADQLENLV